ncbi:MAG: GAF domain-containing protein [Chloroflexota bacterium]
MPEGKLHEQLEELFSDADIPQPRPPQTSTAESLAPMGLVADGEVRVAASQAPQEAPANAGIQTDGSAVGGLRTWQAQLLRVILYTLVVLGGLAVLGIIYHVYLGGRQVWQIPLFLVIYATLLLVTFWRRVPYMVQAGALLALLYGLAVFNLAVYGQTGNGFLLAMAASFFAALFLERRAGFSLLAVTTLTALVFAWLFVSGLVAIPTENQLIVANLGSWLSKIAAFFILTLALIVSQNYLLHRFNDSLAKSQNLAEELEIHRRHLAEQVIERTRQLDRRATLLQAAAEVSRAASSVLDPPSLIRQTVNLVRDRFDYYYVGLFLLDAEGRWAELKAGTGEAGRAMLARSHRLEVGGDSMIGRCTAHGQARIALDVGQEAIRFDNPLLPETRSEMALPLVSRGQIIGALTVQSAEPEAFSEEDITVLQTMADQVADAIENAHLLQETEHLARRNRLVSEISARMGNTLDLDDLLQTTVQEMARALGASEAVIRLHATAPVDHGGDNGSGGSEEVP